jgi:hypothetical protein
MLEILSTFNVFRTSSSESHSKKSVLLGSTDMQLKKLTGLLERRTAVFSPAQGFSASNYHSHGMV